MKGSPEPADFYLCPSCGSELKVGAVECRGCGPTQVAAKMRRKKAGRGKRRRSWAQSPGDVGLGLTSNDFDYEDFVAREFGEGSHKPSLRKLFFVATAVLLIVIFALSLFR